MFNWDFRFVPLNCFHLYKHLKIIPMKKKRRRKWAHSLVEMLTTENTSENTADTVTLGDDNNYFYNQQGSNYNIYRGRWEAHPNIQIQSKCSPQFIDIKIYINKIFRCYHAIIISSHYHNKLPLLLLPVIRLLQFCMLSKWFCPPLWVDTINVKCIFDT